MEKAKTRVPYLLLVEDEESLAIGLEYNLHEEGFDVDLAKDGKKALEYIERNTYDLLILDIMLPYVDGYEIAKRVREQDPQMPILFLSARNETADRIKGLEIGADDYLTKPFHLDELLLRIKGMLRRKSWYASGGEQTSKLNFGENEINFENYMARHGEKEFKLTAHEALLMQYFAAHAGKIVSRDELLKNVWQTRSDIETRTVDNFVMRLRKYFEQDPNKPRFFRSVRGKGYIFELTDSGSNT